MSTLAPTHDTRTVAEVMHRGVVTCELSAPLRSVARMMAAHRIHCVVVWGEPEAEGHEPALWGVVSDLDLVGVAADDDVAGRTAGGTAATPAVTVARTETLRRAAQLMAENQVTHLVVVDHAGTKPVGVISTLDVANAIAESAPRTPA